MQQTLKRKTTWSRIEYDPLPLTPEDWGKICSPPWTKATRRVIGELFKRDGHAFGDELFSEGSAMKYVNRIFIQANVPYRLRHDIDGQRPEREGWDPPVMQWRYELRRILN
jgi:hypothetical protein